MNHAKLLTPSCTIITTIRTTSTTTTTTSTTTTIATPTTITIKVTIITTTATISPILYTTTTISYTTPPLQPSPRPLPPPPPPYHHHHLYSHCSSSVTLTNCVRRVHCSKQSELTSRSYVRRVEFCAGPTNCSSPGRTSSSRNRSMGGGCGVVAAGEKGFEEEGYRVKSFMGWRGE